MPSYLDLLPEDALRIIQKHLFNKCISELKFMTKANGERQCSLTARCCWCGITGLYLPKSMASRTCKRTVREQFSE